MQCPVDADRRRVAGAAGGKERFYPAQLLLTPLANFQLFSLSSLHPPQIASPLISFSFPTHHPGRPCHLRALTQVRVP